MWNLAAASVVLIIHYSRTQRLSSMLEGPSGSLRDIHTRTNTRAFRNGRRHQNEALPGLEPSDIRHQGRRCHQLNHRGSVVTAVQPYRNHMILFSVAAVNRTIIFIEIHILSILNATYSQQFPQHHVCTICATHGSAAVPLFVMDTAGAVKRQYLKASYSSTMW